MSRKITRPGSSSSLKAKTTESLLSYYWLGELFGAARTVFIIVKDASDPNRRIMAPVKSNIGPDTIVNIAERFTGCAIERTKSAQAGGSGFNRTACCRRYGR